MQSTQGPAPSGGGEPTPPRRAGITRLLAAAVPVMAGVLAAAALAWWIWTDLHAPHLTPRLPETKAVSGSDRTAPEAGSGNANPATGLPSATGTPTGASVPTNAAAGLGAGATPARPATMMQGEWPRFRGANLDNVSTEGVRLARSWGPQGPKVLWAVNLGEGFAGPAVSNGRVYVLDYDQGAQADTIRCFSLADGSELWKNSYPVVVKRNHGMSRTVPSVSGKYVVTMGPKCRVVCWDGDNGAIKWQIDLVGQYGATVPDWYAGQCPLIDSGRVIIATGGKALMIAVDLASGRVVWSTPNPNGWRMSHSSVIPVSFNGKRIYVCCFKEGVAGVSASDGSLFWDNTEWRVSTATIPMPVVVGNGRMVIAGGYSAGAVLLELKGSGGRLRAEIAYRLPANVFGSDLQTPIFSNGYVYGVIQGGQLVCLDPSGHQVWTSGHTRRFGLGPYIIAQGMIYLLSDQGVLTLVEATPAGYKQLAQAKVLNGPDAFGSLALAGGRLLARDLTRMVCLDVSG